MLAFLYKKISQLFTTTTTTTTTTPVPTKFKLVQDVDLIDKKTSFVREILTIEKMDDKNYKSLAAFDAESCLYELVVVRYQCDICRTICNVSNPIYTNNRKQGVDICNNCITKAFETIKPDPDFIPGPVYSLSEICRLSKQ